jgi:hypothetical protein
MVVSEGEGETSVPVGPGVTEVFGDERPGIVSTDNDDHPLAEKGVIGSQ